MNATDSLSERQASRPGLHQARERLSFVQPVRIRSGGVSLAGLLQPATGRPAAVLLCNPFGQEAIRAQRALRIVSERLARQGFPCLRFDYHATGDSPGEDGEGRMSRWRHDILQADRLLRKQTDSRQIIWLGLGLGATLALQAAAEAPETARPVRLILWDPVLDGRTYLRHLSRMHEYWTRRAHVTDEALGFRLPEHLRRRIQAIRPDTLPLPEGVPLGLLANPAQPGHAAFLERARQIPGTRDAPQAHSIEWASNTAQGSQWVPDQTVADLISICIESLQ